MADDGAWALEALRLHAGLVVHEYVRDPLFEYVLRQLWIDDGFELPDNWRGRVRSRFISKMQAVSSAVARASKHYEFHEAQLVDALRVLQPRTPRRVRPMNAASAIRQVRRLGSLLEVAP